MVGERDSLIDNLGSESGIFSISYRYKIEPKCKKAENLLLDLETWHTSSGF